MLKRRHQVTIVEPVELLADNGLLGTVDVVALDCGGQPRSGANLIRSFRATYPELRFVLEMAVDVVALDCGGQPRSGANLIRSFRATYPELRFVLVNGGMSQTEIANAFREGADDYFSEECGTALLIERIEHICRRLRESRSKLSH